MDNVYLQVCSHCGHEWHTYSTDPETCSLCGRYGSIEAAVDYSELESELAALEYSNLLIKALDRFAYGRD
jgi:hypothetical protein